MTMLYPNPGYMVDVPVFRVAPEIVVWQKSVHSASLVMPNGNPWDGFYYPTLILMIDSYNPTLTQITDSFSCSSLTIILENHEKGFQKILNSLRCNMMTSFFYIYMMSRNDVQPGCG